MPVNSEQLTKMIEVNFEEEYASRCIIVTYHLINKKTKEINTQLKHSQHIEK